MKPLQEPGNSLETLPPLCPTCALLRSDWLRTAGRAVEAEINDGLPERSQALRDAEDIAFRRFAKSSSTMRYMLRQE
jgi:hypothetical protein